MVEAINIFEQKLSDSKGQRKLFWTGSRLPSMGCLITVFSYYDYRQEVRSVLCQLNKAGRNFFDTHMDNELCTQNHWSPSFPSNRTNLPIKY